MEPAAWKHVAETGNDESVTGTLQNKESLADAAGAA